MTLKANPGMNLLMVFRPLMAPTKISFLPFLMALMEIFAKASGLIFFIPSDPGLSIFMRVSTTGGLSNTTLALVSLSW